MNPIDFVAAIAPHAVADYAHSGVLASITIAQGALESAWGRSAPGNNLFGIKGDGADHETKEFINGEWITVTAGFRVYDSWLGSIKDHSEFLTVNGRYANAGFFDRCKAMDYRGAAQALHTAGYATDPSYADLLIGIIESHNLDQFDMEVKKKMDELLAKIAALETKMHVLEPTPAPDWFVSEFGNALYGILHDPSGDASFWRTTAIALRVINAKLNVAAAKEEVVPEVVVPEVVVAPVEAVVPAEDVISNG